MGIASGIGHFIESIAELIQGFFAAILHTFQFALNSVFDIVQFAINSVLSVFSGFVNFVEGTLGFAFRELTPLPSLFILSHSLPPFLLTFPDFPHSWKMTLALTPTVQTTSSSSVLWPLVSWATWCTRSARARRPRVARSRTSYLCRPRSLLSTALR
jgi:hypothetical protein